MTPAVSTSPHTPNMRSLPSTWPRYSLIAAERVEVALPGVRIVRRDRAPRHRGADAQDGLAEPDPATDPRVLFVRPSALELDEHPEAPCVDRANAKHRAECVERAVADQRRWVLLARPAYPIAAHDADLATEVVGELRGPLAHRHVSDRRPAVDVRLDRLAELDRAFDDAAIGEGQAQHRGVAVRPCRDPHHVTGRQLVDEAAAAIDEVEAAVFGDPIGTEQDLVARFEPEAPHRGDVESGDAGHHPMLPDTPRGRAYAGPVLLGIDHLVIAVADPDAAASELGARLGLTPGGGGRHDRLGTFNRLVWLGDTYLELVGVLDAALAATSWIGTPALRALEAGGGLATWAVATDAIDGDVAVLRARGSDLAEPIAGERLRPDGQVVRWRLSFAPPLGPDRPPFLIEHDPNVAEWTPADRAERAAGPARLAHLELTVDDVSRTGQAFLRTVGLRFRPSLSGGGARDADIGRQTVRLRRRGSRGRSPVAIHISLWGAGPAEFETLGCRWTIQPQAPGPAGG